jgi:hypothetical protein
MGQAAPPQPVLLLLAAFSRHDDALSWTQCRAESHWGPVALVSQPFAFEQTDYYTASMGAHLKKQFYVFENLIDPATIVEIKHITNAWEVEYAQTADAGVPRPLNLDPGYLAAGKLVLASTKDHAHRVYLSKGIYAEVTLHYRHGLWRPHEWTYPDYRLAENQAFFDRARRYLRAKSTS